MRVLLDANIPVRFKRELIGHDVWTAREKQLQNLPDSSLLRAIAGNFDVLVTLDKNLPGQQNLSGRPFAVVVIRAVSNKLADLQPHVPDVLAAIQKATPGTIQKVGC